MASAKSTLQLRELGGAPGARWFCSDLRETDILLLVRLRPNSLALGHHFAVHGAGATIAAVINAGQTTGGYPAISAAVERNQHLEMGLAGACDALTG